MPVAVSPKVANRRNVLTTKHENAAKLAIACCIYQCSESPAPLALLQDYLEELRKHGWDDDDLSCVRRDVIAALIDAATSSDELTGG